jgi:hypothetical protein
MTMCAVALAVNAKIAVAVFMMDRCMFVCVGMNVACMEIRVDLLCDDWDEVFEVVLFTGKSG